MVIVADGQVAEARDQVERRLRERGLSVAWRDAGGSWCFGAGVALAARAKLDADVVVLSVRDDPTPCHDLSSLVPSEGGALVLVVQPGPPGVGQPADVQDRLRSQADGWILADPTPLLGTEGAPELPCEWWDDCRPDGTVVVRDDSGALTAAGGERMARVIAAVVP